jgi:hypothetical protein
LRYLNLKTLAENLFNSTWNGSRGSAFCSIIRPMKHGGRPMNPSERFLRFAAECELMAKLSPSAENELTWHRMAERWIRCAELMEQRSSFAHAASAMKRRRRADPSRLH